MKESKNKASVTNEYAPTAEITIGGTKEKISNVEIAFTSTEGLDSEAYEKIDSILEKHKYDSSELTCKEPENQRFRYNAEGRAILDCSLRCGNIDPETESEIRKFLKSVPYVKLSS